VDSLAQAAELRFELFQRHRSELASTVGPVITRVSRRPAWGILLAASGGAPVGGDDTLVRLRDAVATLRAQPRRRGAARRQAPERTEATSTRVRSHEATAPSPG
jgi:hypothetical protein